MNWEAIGAIGEVLGAIGVIATLGYLAVQIRQNTQATSASALNLALRDINELTNNNERYLAVLTKAGRNEALTIEESAHLVERLVSIMRTYENFWYQYQLGNLTLNQFENQVDVIRWTLSTRTSRKLWRTLQSSFDEGFVDYVQENVMVREAPKGSLLEAFEQTQQSSSS